MTILKCKMCGGNIELTGKSHGICDSCSSEVTLPKIDDDKRADMYNRGNHFRQSGDFDRAYSAYEHIVADDQGDAEAHWCLTLCRYGVEYVKDPRFGDYKPTISRMSYESILDDPDYLAALEASDAYTKDLYRREARKIDNIQRRYLEISRQEPPYDVFICFKAEDANGQRTKGSVLAQEIYENLTGKGLKVFFSRITLENKLSEEYEPYIFAALHSAKVMLLVANAPEQLEARWVKNEWSRFLRMKAQDNSRQIVPVYLDMTAYDFPMEIPTTAAQDMSRTGAMQDLVRGVCKLTGHDPDGNAGGGQPLSIDQMLGLAWKALTIASFDEANVWLEEVLNRDPENGDAYYIGFLVNHRQLQVPVYASAEQIGWMDDRYFRRALQYGSEEHKAELIHFRQSCDELRFLKQAADLYEQNNFNGCLKALRELETMVREEAYQIQDKKRWAELGAAAEKELEAIRQKEHEAEILRQNIQAYKDEVGDPTTYVKRMLKKHHAGEIKKYEDMTDKMKRLEVSAFPIRSGLVRLFTLFILTGMYANMMAFPDVLPMPSYICMTAMLLFEGIPIMFLRPTNPTKIANLIKITIISVLVSVPIYLALEATGNIGIFLHAILMIILHIICAFRLCVRMFHNLRLRSTAKARKKYEQTVLAPLDTAIRQRLADRWLPLIGTSNLIRIPAQYLNRNV